MIHGKQFTGTRKAALHFIGNHHNTVLVAQAANGGNQLFWRNVETALALHRFENNGRHLLRFNVRFKQAFDGVEGVLC